MHATFEDCINLAEISVDENNQQLQDIDGVLYNKAGRNINCSRICLFKKNRNSCGFCAW